jgi:hypothetical protein
MKELKNKENITRKLQYLKLMSIVTIVKRLQASSFCIHAEDVGLHNGSKLRCDQMT